MKNASFLILIFCSSILWAQPICELGTTWGFTGAFQNEFISFRSDTFNREPGHYSYLNHRGSNGLFILNANVFLNFFSFKYLVFCLDVGYNPKGSRYEIHDGVWNGFDYEDSMWIAEIRLDYLSIAVKGKPRIIIKRCEVFLICGFSLDLAVNKKSTYIENVNNKFRNFDISVPFGIGLGYKATNKFKIQIELQGQPSIINSYIADSNDIRNNLIKINAGLVYSFFR